MDVRQVPLPPLPHIRNRDTIDTVPTVFPTPSTPVASSANKKSTANHVAAASSSAKSQQKRRGSTTGSRSVAKLTPEQLAKKRQNDREAQKAIRERTRAQIENLEKRIRELTEQKPYQELQEVIRQKQVIEAENEDIKRRLSSILSIAQPICRQTGISGQPCIGENGLATQLFNSDAFPTRQLQPIISAPSVYETSPSSVRRASSTTSTYHPSPQSARQTLPPTPVSYGPQPLAIPPVNTFDQPRGTFSASINGRPPTDEKLELGYLLQGRNNSNGSNTVPYNAERTPSVSSLSNPPLQTLSPFPDESRPAYAVPPKQLNMCPLDGLMMKYLADQRQKAVDGASVQELIGPPYPHFKSLVDPGASRESHHLSRVFTDILDKFPDISTLPEQVAILYIMFLIMRWQIHPSQETYDALPDWVTPRPSQLFTPHPAWVDHLPWPRMRDRMVRIYTSIPIDDFFIPYTTTVSLNWPYDPNEVLLQSPGPSKPLDFVSAGGADTDMNNNRGPNYYLNPVFERHLRDLGNWSLGQAFAKAHPSLADTFRIK